MGKTQDKIIAATIDLFNQRGVSAVRVHDIAKHLNISPGNLTYHFKTKKELMLAVFDEMNQALKDMSISNQTFLENLEWGQILRYYFHYQIKYRFFNRDILEIINVVPEIKGAYQKQLNQIISFSTNAINRYVEEGIFKPEAHPRHYETLAINGLAILSSWLIHWDVIGREKIDITGGIRSVIELHYPYFTEKGLDIYYKTKNELPAILKADLEANNLIGTFTEKEAIEFIR